jgi:putative transposase
MTDMRKSKYTEEQVIGFLKQAEAGVPIKDLPQGRLQRSDVLQVALEVRRHGRARREAAA